MVLGEDVLGSTHERVFFWGDAATKYEASADGIDVSAFKGAIISLDTLLERKNVIIHFTFSL